MSEKREKWIDAKRSRLNELLRDPTLAEALEIVKDETATATGETLAIVPGVDYMMANALENARMTGAASALKRLQSLGRINPPPSKPPEAYSHVRSKKDGNT